MIQQSDETQQKQMFQMAEEMKVLYYQQIIYEMVMEVAKAQKSTRHLDDLN